MLPTSKLETLSNLAGMTLREGLAVVPVARASVDVEPASLGGSLVLPYADDDGWAAATFEAEEDARVTELLDDETCWLASMGA